MSWRETLNVGELTVGKIVMSGLLYENTAQVSYSQTAVASGKNAINVNNSFTYATSGVHKGIQVDVSYDPDGDSGYATTVALAAKAQLSAGMSHTGGVGYMWGVQGQMDFGASSVVNHASSIFAALRGVLTASGTPVFTDAYGICNLYLDNLISTNMTGLAVGFSSMIYMANGGGLMHSAIRVYGPSLQRLFYLDTCTNGGMVGNTAETGGTSKKIKIDIDGTDYYLNAYTG